jgi:hypothetical protein
LLPFFLPQASHTAPRTPPICALWVVAPPPSYIRARLTSRGSIRYLFTAGPHYTTRP